MEIMEYNATDFDKIVMVLNLQLFSKFFFSKSNKAAELLSLSSYRSNTDGIQFMSILLVIMVGVPLNMIIVLGF